MKLTLPKDFREFIECLNTHEVKYVVIGGYAVAWHGHPRFTGDVDFFIECTPENAERVVHAINDFGFESLGLKSDDFTTPGIVVQFGRPPRRIDLLTGVDGLEFSDTWNSRESASLDGLPVPMISKRHLILSKRAAGRPKDHDDLLYLEEP